jgi:peptidoglycan/LPS O-acetylase OafA/YrhL
VSLATLRNIAIILALGAIVAFAPGGGEGADLISQLLGAVFTIVIALLLGRFYVQFRSEIYGLGDTWRAVLYVAVGVIVVTLAASSRLFDSGAGALAWFALMGGAAYALYLTWRQYRAYA